MSDPYVAEVKIFAGNFAPRGWAFCDGQLLQISQNTALFSLIGTTYGGDGRTTTGLPNLQGRAPMHPGRGPGLTPRSLGETGGYQTHTLTNGEMPNHTHALQVTTQPAQEDDPQNDALLAAGPTAASLLYGVSTSTLNERMAGAAIPNYGGSQAHDNTQPVQALNYIIALTGSYPSRS